MLRKKLSSPLLMETIKIENGLISNLSYHQNRCNQSRKKLYNCNDTLHLKDVIYPPKKGLYRCRILYAENIVSVEYIPYNSRNIKTIKVISSTLNYRFKYANRENFTILLAEHPEVDEILIEKNGFITDTSIANIAFYDGSQWYTPTTPLLNGTVRQKLLDEGFLQTKAIKNEDLKYYTQVALMNAMLGFNIQKNIHIQDIEGNTYDY